jgi:hypothetical protein
VCKNDDCFLQGELKILKGKQEPGETRAKLWMAPQTYSVVLKYFGNRDSMRNFELYPYSDNCLGLPDTFFSILEFRRVSSKGNGTQMIRFFQKLDQNIRNSLLSSSLIVCVLPISDFMIKIFVHKITNFFSRSFPNKKFKFRSCSSLLVHFLNIHNSILIEVLVIERSIDKHDYCPTMSCIAVSRLFW